METDVGLIGIFAWRLQIDQHVKKVLRDGIVLKLRALFKIICLDASL
jgi:hypothetical protein